MKLKIVKYIAIIFTVAFIINFIGGMGINIWGVNKIVESNKKSYTSEKSYNELKASQDFNEYYEPIIDSLIYANPQLALSYIDSVKTIYPNHYYLAFQKGLAYYQLDSLQVAINHFDKSMEISKWDIPIALEYKARSLVALDKFDEAILQLEKAADINEDYNFHLAQVYELKGDYIKTIEYYNIVLNNWDSGTTKVTWYKKINALKIKIEEVKKLIN